MMDSIIDAVTQFGRDTVALVVFGSVATATLVSAGVLLMIAYMLSMVMAVLSVLINTVEEQGGTHGTKSSSGN